ncbi:hypothetical protein [Mucilaginibacter sp. dw_454]|uniref:hypothetical protein n=1 Tax=Mucilaginibacter sp. dw_454 TaxID=2720079 RepID=UPI001BD43947|nr:hypothetical protein [Mucilaginibacter sp. dw_454]
MKKIFLLAFAAIAFAACNDSKNDEKTVLNDVIKIHDTVMAHSDQLMHDKMKLDTLLKTADDTAKTKISLLISKLNNADGQMEDFMQKFDPEQKGKSHDYMMNYLTAQKIRIHAVDSMINSSVKESSEYLKHLKK